MKNTILIIIVIASIGCPKSNKNTISNYFDLIKKSELLVCEGKFKEATKFYKQSFKQIEKPFGKDLFNAALANQLSNQYEERNRCLQSIINNSDDLEFVKTNFVGAYISELDWQTLISKKETLYNPNLREEFKEIHAKDQMFRPMYETHDDTINSARKLNIARILSLTDSIGFPSQIELGYTNYLRGQKHDIVLHHTAQRRSYDKTVLDLEPILFEAIQNGRFDPDQAIFYLNFQNDQEKGRFEVYSTWQFKHPLLPDSLNNNVWLMKLDENQKIEANNIRKKWNANSLEEIAIKSTFLAKSNLPFIFTCVHKSIANLADDFDQEKALSQYKGMTRSMEKYKIKTVISKN